MRFAAVVLLCCISFFTVGSAANAQEAPAEIEVRVVDAAGHPVGNARVFINGPLSTSALTPNDGIIRFEDVTPGIYAIRVARPGFDGADVPEIEALAGRLKIVTARIVSRSATTAAGASGEKTPDGDLRVIGTVRAKPSVTIENVDIDADSPIRRISENLTDALSKLGGITVFETPKTGSLTISLRNADPSSTVVSAGGVPLVGGGGGALQSVAAELSSGVSANANSSISAAGGAVNFRTLEPTRTWQTQFSSSYGSYQKASEQIAISGSIKKLGIAVQHAVRTGDSVLTGLTFEDASGLTYVHDGSNAIDADFVKLRYAVNPKLSLNASILGGETKRSPLCDLDFALLPCGSGPGGLVTNGSTNRAVGAAGQIGDFNISMNIFNQTYSTVDDELGRAVAGVPEPFHSDTSGTTKGFFFFGTVPIHRHTLLANIGSYDGSGEVKTVTSAGFGGSSPSSYRYAYTVTGDTYKFSDHTSVTLAYGLNTGLQGSRSAVDLTVALTPSRTESLSFGIGQYGAGATTTFLGFAGDPASATFDCAGNEVLTTVSSDAPVAATQTTGNITYSRRGKRGSIRASAYTRANNADNLMAQYPIAAYTGVPLPAGYLGAIQNIWQSPTVCGAQPFDPSRVYVNQQLAGLHTHSRGYDTSGQLVLGRAVIAQGTYSTGSYFLTSLDPRLLVAGSPYTVGGQLPGVALHRASLLFDAAQPRAHLEYIANASWTAGNNQFGLGSYVVASAGISWTAERGKLTLFANNLFNSDTGLFTRTEFLNPVATIGGGTYLPLAPALLPPRSYTLLYSVRSGRTR